MYLHIKDPKEAKCQHLSNKCENVDVEQLKNPKSHIEYSNNMQDVYKNIKKYNPGSKYNLLIVFDDMITDIITNKKLIEVVNELLITGRKLNIATAFITKPEIKDHILKFTRFLL